MPDKSKFRIGFLDKLSEKVDQIEKRNLEAETRRLIETEEEIYNKAAETANLTPVERAEKYKREKQERKSEKKSWFYRICGFTPNKTTFFRPLTSSAEQKQVEGWWFSITLFERQKYMQQLKSGFRNSIIRHVLEYAEYETNKLTGKKPPGIPFVPEFYKYWFVYIIFALLVCSLIVNFKLQSVVIASIGAILCSFVLFFSRVLRVRRGLGLKIFCPVTLGWLKTLYVQVHFPEISQTTKQTKKDGLNVG